MIAFCFCACRHFYTPHRSSPLSLSLCLFCLQMVPQGMLFSLPELPAFLVSIQICPPLYSDGAHGIAAFLTRAFHKQSLSKSFLIVFKWCPQGLLYTSPELPTFHQSLSKSCLLCLQMVPTGTAVSLTGATQPFITLYLSLTSFVFRWCPQGLLYTSPELPTYHQSLSKSLFLLSSCGSCRSCCAAHCVAYPPSISLCPISFSFPSDFADSHCCALTGAPPPLTYFSLPKDGRLTYIVLPVDSSKMGLPVEMKLLPISLDQALFKWYLMLHFQSTSYSDM